MQNIEVAHLRRRQSLGVSIRFPDVRLLPKIVSRVRRLFDLGADIETINDHLSGDPVLAPLVASVRVTDAWRWDGFGTACGQCRNWQITVVAARRLAGQLVALHGRVVPKSFCSSGSVECVSDCETVGLGFNHWTGYAGCAFDCIEGGSRGGSS